MGAGPTEGPGILVARCSGPFSLPVAHRRDGYGQGTASVPSVVCDGGSGEQGLPRQVSSALKRDTERGGPYPACGHCRDDVRPDTAADVFDFAGGGAGEGPGGVQGRWAG